VKEDPDSLAPAHVASFYDFVDMLTWYSRRQASMGSRVKSETKIFGHFYDIYTTERKTAIKGLSIPAYLPDRVGQN
jgi:hypothetical protein